MIFTSFDFVWFLAVVFVLYWLVCKKTFQNLILLFASYVFYGWIHPWFCILIAVSTVVDYLCALGMGSRILEKKWFLCISLVCNLGLLGVFKYFNFFVDNFCEALGTLGFNTSPLLWRIYLPVGISFYTFQTLSYTIDVYAGRMAPRKNIIDFALYVSFFSQLVAGPIERATHFLPQIEKERKWNWRYITESFDLMVRGYLKKLVIADNIAVLVDQIYSLDSVSLPLLYVGTLGFALQVYADFSAYTDIARGSAKLLGFDLMRNFNSPFLARRPSEFWERWHMSLSRWFQDYLYYPLAMYYARRGTGIKNRCVPYLVTFILIGFWHGAAWNFIVFGFFWAIVVILEKELVLRKRKLARKRVRLVEAEREGSFVSVWKVLLVFHVILFSFAIFRTPEVTWLTDNILSMLGSFAVDDVVAAWMVLCHVGFYSIPFFAMLLIDRNRKVSPYLKPVFYYVAILMIIFMHRPTDMAQDFVYFQF